MHVAGSKGLILYSRVLEAHAQVRPDVAVEGVSKVPAPAVATAG
jgi:hypothetical protein